MEKNIIKPFTAFSPTIFDFHDVPGFYFREGEPEIPELTEAQKSYMDGVIAKTRTEAAEAARVEERNKITQAKTKEQQDAERQKAIDDGNIKTQLELTQKEKDDLAKELEDLRKEKAANEDLKLRQKACKDSGLDIKHASRLEGKTEAEYLADAKSLAEDLGGKETKTNMEGGRQDRKTTKEQVLNGAKAHVENFAKMI